MAEQNGQPSLFQIRLGGQDLPDELARAVLEVHVEGSLFLPAVASIVLNDSKLRWVDDDSVGPGVALEVLGRSGRSYETLFDGEIVELELEFRSSTQRLIVRAMDRLHRLTRGRHVRSFVNVSDSDLVEKMAAESELQAETDAPGEIHEYVFQNNETNLAFLQRRARALGCQLYAEGKTLHFVQPDLTSEPVALKWGETLTEFLPRLTTLDQVRSVTVRGWDPTTRQEVIGQIDDGKRTSALGESRAGAELVSEAFQAEPALYVTRTVRSQGEAENLARSIADARAERAIEAEGVCTGQPGVRAGARIRLEAVGDRFGGTYSVTTASHRYTPDEGYSTEFTISGRSPTTLLDLMAPPEEDRPTLAVAIVTDNQDPKNEGRVKVRYPWLSSDHASDWARVVSPGGGAGRGLQVLPEINDEVLVGFELGDLHHPYVLGGLWNGQDPPPEPSAEVIGDGEVQRRLFRSRTGHMLLWDDSDPGGGITIEDRNGNRVHLDSKEDGITIEARGDITLRAEGALRLEAGAALELEGMGVTMDGKTGQVKISGSIIDLN